LRGQLAQPVQRAQRGRPAQQDRPEPLRPLQAQQEAPDRLARPEQTASTAWMALPALRVQQDRLAQHQLSPVQPESQVQLALQEQIPQFRGLRVPPARPGQLAQILRLRGQLARQALPDLPAQIAR